MKINIHKYINNTHLLLEGKISDNNVFKNILYIFVYICFYLSLNHVDIFDIDVNRIVKSTRKTLVKRGGVCNRIEKDII